MLDLHEHMHFLTAQKMKSYAYTDPPLKEKAAIPPQLFETDFKKIDLSQDTQFYYFLTQNLSKISFKNTNNFI